MHRYVRPRAKEIKDRLGPMLLELGLTTGAVLEEHRHHVFFQSGRSQMRPSYFSPVEIVFAGREQGDPSEATWDRAWLYIQKYERKPLGETGFECQDWWEDDVLDIPEDDLERFKFLEIVIRAHGVFHLGRPPNRVSREVADAYFAVREVVENLGVVKISLDGREVIALTFQDHQGRRVHLCPDSGDTLLIDGKIVGECRSEDYRNLAYRLSRGRDFDDLMWPSKFRTKSGP